MILNFTIINSCKIYISYIFYKVGFGIIDEEIEDFDLKAETDSALRRHRRIEEENKIHFDNLNRKELNSRNASRGIDQSVHNEYNANNDQIHEEFEDNTKYLEKHYKSNNSIMPFKQMKINKKSLILGRKDMQEIEDIEKSLVIPDERLKNSAAIMKSNAEKALLITEICSNSV